MEEPSLIAIINTEMGIDLPLAISFDEMRQRLQAIVHNMIEHQFQQLVNCLYRIDVNERKLKYLLQENVGADAAVIIVDLIIERQLQKMETRKQFRQADKDISDEDKW
ncbi:MAG: hypothetical protein ABIQ88_11855 [Chitinophagaceae bacterium]